MPETTVTAIVLRRNDSFENDRRLVLLTRELGKIDAIAKGARKVGSRLAGSSEPLVFAEFQLAAGRVVRYVTQAQPISSIGSLRRDYDRLLCGLALVELVAELLPYESPQPEIFDRVTLALSRLSGDEDAKVPLVWFSARLLAEEGHMPDWKTCAVSGQRIDTTPVWISPRAGGAVSEVDADRFHDRRSVSSEALKGIALIAELQEPPTRLKRASECCAVLHAMWQAILDSPLPAWGAVVQSGGESGE